MKKLFTLTLVLLITFMAFADEGDTIVVQTIDFETPVLPGWNSPRAGMYQFPGDTISFSKILMAYTLKCDPGQSPACGEWDYTTHTKVRVHTGVYDSTEYSHPKFKINNSAPDTLEMMNQVSYYYQPWLEYNNQTAALTEVLIGEDNSTIDLPFGDANDGRAQFIYQGTDLLADGLSAGNLTGLVFTVDGNIEFEHFSIKIKYADDDTLPLHKFEEEDLFNVFEKNISLVNGENQIDFSFPFYWNGASDLLFDISYSKHSGSGTMAASTTDAAETQVSAEVDSFLHFSGWDLVEMPSEVFETLDGDVTISLWQYGDAAKQPMNNSVFYGFDENNKKILNVHLPWSNSQVYFDAGQNGGDRINHGADAEDYEGRWNHWTFVKKSGNGSMRMYLNGQIFYPGSGKYKTMEGVFKFFIGGAYTANYYEGFIDDFCVWDTAVDFLTIKDWVYREIDESHPYYDNLRAYYKFDEGDGIETGDDSPHEFNAIDFFGRPQWKSYEGNMRHKHGQRLNEKPLLKLQTGDYNASLLDSLVVVDTFEHAAQNIIFYDPLDPVTPTDTILKWPTYYNNYVYDEGGIAIDSTFVNPDTILHNEDFIYYGDPYEILDSWEISRFITPYGNNLSLGEGFTWVYDVTDYEPLFHDSVDITAGNFQELLDLKFYMIEGTPPRDIVKLDKVYSGYWYLSQFEDKVPPKKFKLADGASQWKVKTRTTGHLFSNPTNCAEFCEKTHTFLVEEQPIASWEIIQECAENPLYPQGGTWIYDRAGWCPGMDVTEHDFEITQYVNSNDSVLLDYNSEYDEYGTYNLETHLFSFGDFNFTNDAAVAEVIAPNNKKRYGRFNPSVTNPIIKIQNLGGANLTSVEIVYGPQGVTPKIYNWTGNLEPMQQQEVILDAFEWEEWQTGNGRFEVHLQNPNGAADENTVNDWYFTDYDQPDIYPGTFVIHLKTNKVAYQNNYEILNKDGIQLFQRDNLENETLYVDTISLPNDCYDFYLYDSGDNGIGFWAEPGQGNGYLKFYDLNGDKIKQFNSDFGDRVYNSFYTDIYLGKMEIEDAVSLSVNPNPNHGSFVVSYAAHEKTDLKLKVHDSQGRLVFAKDYKSLQSGVLNIDLGNVAPGVYNLSVESDKGLSTEKFVVW